MRSFLALFRNQAKGIWVDTDATEGAVVGENLFVRMDDGSLALFQPSDGTIVDETGATQQVNLTNPSVARRTRARNGVAKQQTTRRTVTRTAGSGAGRMSGILLRPGSNSGYDPRISPATPQTGFDLDPNMIAGLPDALNPYPEIPAPGHPFGPGSIVRLSGGSYIAAQANNAVNGEVVGMVASVKTGSFRICCGGRVPGLSGLVAGSVYFLSTTTPGAMSLTDPLAGGVIGQVSKPVFIADSATSGYFMQLRGEVVGGSAAGGGLPDVTANPASPTPFMRVRRTNLTIGPAVIYWDAVANLWLTEEVFPLDLGAQTTPPAGTSSGQWMYAPIRQDYAPYVTTINLTAAANTTNNASNFYSVQLNVLAANQTGAVAIGTPVSTAGVGVGVFAVSNQTPNFTVPAGKALYMYQWTKTGAPGAIFPACSLNYRLIIP